MITATTTRAANPVLDRLDSVIEPVEDFYRVLHAHPDLSDRSNRTAAKSAEQLEWAGWKASTALSPTTRGGDTMPSDLVHDGAQTGASRISSHARLIAAGTRRG